MKLRSSLIVIYSIAFLLLLGFILPNLVFGQEGQPPYPPRKGKVWNWEPAHWEPARAWRPGAPPIPSEPPPVSPRVRRYWKWQPSKWRLVINPPVGPHEWSPAHWDPVEHRWVPGVWARINVIPSARNWVPGVWDRSRRIWIAGHWEPVEIPTVRPTPPPAIVPPSPMPPAPPIVAPPPGPPPGPPPVIGPTPPRPPRPPRPGFHWEWDPVVKRWVQRPNP